MHQILAKRLMVLVPGSLAASRSSQFGNFLRTWELEGQTWPNASGGARNPDQNIGPDPEDKRALNNKFVFQPCCSSEKLLLCKTFISKVLKPYLYYES